MALATASAMAIWPGRCSPPGSAAVARASRSGIGSGATAATLPPWIADGDDGINYPRPPVPGERRPKGNLMRRTVLALSAILGALLLPLVGAAGAGISRPDF